MRKLLATTTIIAASAAPLTAAPSDGPLRVTEAVGGNLVSVAELINRAVYVQTVRGNQVIWSDWTDVPDAFAPRGEIEDLLLAPDGNVRTAVVGEGGLLDIGETGMTVDISKLGVVMDADDSGDFYVVFTGDPSDLDAARVDNRPGDGPGTATTPAAGARGGGADERSNRQVVAGASRGGVRGASNVAQPSMQSRMEAAGQDLMGYASVTPGTGKSDGPRGPSSARQTQREAAARGDYFGAAPPVAQEEGVNVSADGLSAEDLEWVPVYSANGEWIGDIGDLTLDENGNIVEAIVDMGGFLGLGETPVSVPFDKVTLKRAGAGQGLRAYVQMSAASIGRLKTETGGS